MEQAFFTRLNDHEKAKDYTFNLLGLISSNGVNTWQFAPCGDGSFKMAIYLLGLGSQTLDQRTAKNGFLYTYPKEINSLCDYGKNYHFWMSAFLAREAVKQSGDKIASAAAAFTLNKGYQFMKKAGGRDPTRAFRENTFSNYNNNMRLDLTQAAAGAWYGALSVEPSQKTLSRDQFDDGLRKIFDGAQPSPEEANFQFPEASSPLKMMATYSTWKKTINPDAAYNYYEELIGQ